MTADSTGDVERLQTIFAAWGRADFSDGEVIADDFVWAPADGIEVGERRGRKAFSESWSTFLEAWDEFRVEAEEIIPAPDGRYVVMQIFRGIGKSSGVESEDRTAVLITMRDGKIARMEGFWDRDAALRAAGIQP